MKNINDKISKTLKEIFVIKDLKFSKDEITFTSFSQLNQNDINEIEELVKEAYEIYANPDMKDIDVDIEQDFHRTGANYVTITIFK